MQGNKVMTVLMLVVVVAVMASAAVVYTAGLEGPDGSVSQKSRVDTQAREIAQLQQELAQRQQTYESALAERKTELDSTRIAFERYRDAKEQTIAELEKKLSGQGEITDVPTALAFIDSQAEQRKADLNTHADDLMKKVANPTTEQVKEQLALIDQQEQERRRLEREQRQEQAKKDRINKMAEQLGLDEVQKAQFEGLLAEQEAQGQDMMTMGRDQMRGLFEELRNGNINLQDIQTRMEEGRLQFEQMQQEQREAMAQLLNEEQMQTWDKIAPQPQDQLGRGLPFGGGQGGQGGPGGGIGEMFQRFLGGGNNQGGNNQGGNNADPNAPAPRRRGGRGNRGTGGNQGDF